MVGISQRTQPDHMHLIDHSTRGSFILQPFDNVLPLASSLRLCVGHDSLFSNTDTAYHSQVLSNTSAPNQKRALDSSGHYDTIAVSEHLAVSSRILGSRSHGCGRCRLKARLTSLDVLLKLNFSCTIRTWIRTQRFLFHAINLDPAFFNPPSELCSLPDTTVVDDEEKAETFFSDFTKPRFRISNTICLT